MESDLRKRSRAVVQYQLGGARRSQKPSSGIEDKVASVVSDVLGPGYTVRLYSGQEPAGARPVGAKHRHPKGYAGDFQILDPNGNVITDTNRLRDVAVGMAARYDANIGYDERPGRYMGPGRMHIDTMPTHVFGGGKQWGETARSWLDELEQARTYGSMPRSYAMLPQEGPTPPAKGVGSGLPVEQMSAYAEPAAPAVPVSAPTQLAMLPQAPAVQDVAPVTPPTISPVQPDFVQLAQAQVSRQVPAAAFAPPVAAPAPVTAVAQAPAQAPMLPLDPPVNVASAPVAAPPVPLPTFGPGTTMEPAGAASPDGALGALLAGITGTMRRNSATGMQLALAAAQAANQQPTQDVIRNDAARVLSEMPTILPRLDPAVRRPEQNNVLLPTRDELLASIFGGSRNRTV